MDYMADFETTTDENDCRVWAWAICEIDNPANINYGNDIESFMTFCESHGGVYYFHNLQFDGEFILHHLLKSGYELSDTLASRTFKTLISAMGKFYQLEVCFSKQGKKKMKKAVFKDSLKKLPMPVSRIAKAFNLPISKLEIDYNEYREIGHQLTDQEKDYITNDVVIVASALHHQFEQGLDRLTVGSDALASYKAIVGDKWGELFPEIHIEMDANIRRAYKGGFTYANPAFQSDVNHSELIQGAGSVYDVNSLYPDVMYNRPLPVGKPVYFRGEYQENGLYPLYIQYLTCSCKLKKNHIPTLQIKRNPFFCETEYIADTGGAVDLAMTNIDLDLLLEHYNVTVLSYNGGYMFKQVTGIFRDYIDYWMAVKEANTGGLRQLAKLMLNSLYGKFATNPDVTPKLPYLKEDGSVGYRLGEKDTRKPVYTPIGCFITAWARHKTISAAQNVYDRFMYADTDSIHVLGAEPVEGLEVHPTHLGAWKHEANFTRAKYIRAKTYMEEVYQVGDMVDGLYTMVDVEPYLDVKCAGLPAELKSLVTFENFKPGLQLFGKLRPKHVPGGIVLVPTTFTLT